MTLAQLLKATWSSTAGRSIILWVVYTVACILIGMYDKDTMYSLCIYVLNITIVFASIFRGNPDCVYKYFAYLSGAYYVIMFYSIFIVDVWALFMCHVSHTNIFCMVYTTSAFTMSLCVYFLLVVWPSYLYYASKTIRIHPAALLCYTTVVTVPIFITHIYSFIIIFMLRHECFVDIKVTVVCMIRWWC